MTNEITVADAIESIHRDHGLTVTEIAAVLRVSERTLYRWIEGKDFPTQARVDLLNVLLKKGKDVANALDNIYADLMEPSAAMQQPGSESSF